MSILPLIVLAVLASADAALKVNHLTQMDDRGRVVELDVMHDEEDQTIITVVGDVSKYENTDQTINLHDLKTGYGVLKNINEKLCTITKTPMKNIPFWKFEQGFTTEIHKHDLTYIRKQMTNKDVLELAGPKIAEFCKDYYSFQATVTPKRSVKAVTLVEQGREMWCVISHCLTTNSVADLVG
ncbi:uncharacterized protein LOC127880835 [Dreissena polymorpha]|uniref:Uncharacterized protein n=1 Tax=Dreissena polymorpha TaxID=45954 RepID=A0A9D4JUB1_DREPO|nr:uncharacterized protein LOC127880835 [Dreissena polymorpha]KAH3820507.1 hypothetical protein DPMN_122253 [Dreissena polymorpha]